MAYATDLAASARRHLAAANELAAGTRRDVAGYLFGIAAECAVKAIMWEHKFRPIQNYKTKGDPFFEHFPELRTTLRNNGWGRRMTSINRFIQDDGFLNHWDTNMRYSHGKDIEEAWIASWQVQAKLAVDLIGT